MEGEEDCTLVPAHVWTPWFGVFGSKSGFNSLEECFDELTGQIFAIETGLSSDPPMNWRIPFLDSKAVISSSDSHSLPRIGREATMFDADLSYAGIMNALRTRDRSLVGTVEFFPEEGRYHYDGHRDCNVAWSPEETKSHKGICTVCGKPVTVGVMARVDELAAKDRPAGFKPAWAKPFYNFVPFDEVIAEALGVGAGAKSVWKVHGEALQRFGSEFEILLRASESDLRAGLQPEVAEAVVRMRAGKVHITPGYDGEYGKISIFDDAERAGGKPQKSLF